MINVNFLIDSKLNKPGFVNTLINLSIVRLYVRRVFQGFTFGIQRVLIRS